MNAYLVVFWIWAFLTCRVLSSFGSFTCTDDLNNKLNCRSVVQGEFQELTCQPASECPSDFNYCVRSCPEIEDLLLDLKHREMSQYTKNLLSATIQSRKCSLKSATSAPHYCCSAPELKSDVKDNFGILVTTGYSYDGYLSSSELKDTSDQFSACRELPEYPFALDGAVGTTLSDALVLVCGGKLQSVQNDISVPDCHYLELKSDNLRWKNWKPMRESRSLAAAVSVPGQGFFVAGGANGDGPQGQHQDLETTEVLTPTGSEWTIGPSLPNPVSRHCLAQVGNHITVLIGGSSYGSTQDQVWILDWKTRQWSLGPTLRQRREDHACGAMKLEDGRYLVLVAGGRNAQQAFASVDYIEFDADFRPGAQWSKGPPLDKEVINAKMVTVPLKNGNEALLLVGGYVQIVVSERGIGYSKDILLFKADPANDGYSWHDLSLKLNKGRFQHVVLPLKLAPSDCS